MANTKTLREQILAADDIATSIETIPEWGDVKVEVRGLTVGEMEKVSRNDRGGLSFPHLLVVSCWDPDSGEKLFEPADIDALGQKATGPVQRLAGVAMTLNGWGDDEDKETDTALGEAVPGTDTS